MNIVGSRQSAVGSKAPMIDISAYYREALLNN
jgi:hypothetical protein